MPRPECGDLPAHERALRLAADVWPRAGAGRLDLALLRRPVHLSLPLVFSDGTRLSLAALLQRHRALYVAVHPRRRRPLGEIPEDSQSQDYLVWALRLVTNDPALATTSPHREPTRTIEVSGAPVTDWTDLRALRRVMRGVMTHSPLVGIEITDYWVVIPGQGRRRLSYVLRDHWKALRQRMIADGTLAAEVTKEAISQAALDIIYYDLFADARPHPRSCIKDPIVTRLSWPRGTLVPTISTLAGALATAATIAQAPEVHSLTELPRDNAHRRVFVWPTGEAVRYHWFLHELRRHLVKAAQMDPIWAERFFAAPPDLAHAYAVPNAFTRQALHRTLRSTDPATLLTARDLADLLHLRPRADGSTVVRTDSNGSRILRRRPTRDAAS